MTTARTITALLTGLTTAAYYAVPDVARTRATRGWLKAACAAAAVAVAVPDARQAWTELREARALRASGGAFDSSRFDGTVLAGVPVATENVALSIPDHAEDDPAPSAGTHRTVVRGAVVTAAMVASTAGTIAFERWVFRRGEARAAAGARFAHTRTGLVLGALAAIGALFPDTDEKAGDVPS